MSLHVTDSVLFGHLWSTPEMSRWFDDAGRLEAWTSILVVLAEAQAEVGVIPAEAAATIRSDCRADRLDLEVVAAHTRASGHSTLGLIRALREILPEPAARWVYHGATVQDVTDTWTALSLRHVGDILQRDLDRLIAAARSLAEAHRDTPMCGRTHGQPGLPITFGFKVAVWIAELDRHRQRLAQGRARWEVAELGGALGTLEFFGDAALPLLEAFASRLSLGVPSVPWLTARDAIAEFTTLLALVTGTLAKIGTEVYELQRPEIGELREPARVGQVGSITMPHKRNPERSEHLDTLARLVRKDAAVAVEGVIAAHERDGRSWKAEWALLPEACAMSGVALMLGIELLEGLEVDVARMRANLDAQGDYLCSEPMMRALGEHIGKHEAHEVVYTAALRGRAEGTDLRLALLEDRAVVRHLDAAALDAALDPTAALGAAPAFVDRVLAATAP